jgi:hypothetical protein
MAKSALHYCNNCGRRIQPHQSKLEIKVRYSLDYYHETWEGCYESTRESGKQAMTKLETELVKITPIY